MYSGLRTLRFSFRFMTWQSHPRESSSLRSPTKLIDQLQTGGGQLPICRMRFTATDAPSRTHFRESQRELDSLRVSLRAPAGRVVDTAVLWHSWNIPTAPFRGQRHPMLSVNRHASAAGLILSQKPVRHRLETIARTCRTQ